jgi:glucose-6-phosphate isomerase
MKYSYLRRTAGYTLLDHKRNDEILEELHVTPLEEKLCTYRHNWFQHFHRLEVYRLPKQLLNYHPKEDGRPLKRLLDNMAARPKQVTLAQIRDGI